MKVFFSARLSVSRVLFYLVIYLGTLLLVISSGSYDKPRRETYMGHISLQQIGFTWSQRHRYDLWALTPLVSPFPA